MNHIVTNMGHSTRERLKNLAKSGGLADGGGHQEAG